MRVLQIANGYFGNRIYYNFFNTLEEKNIDNIIFVPQKINCNKENNQDCLNKNIFAPECFSYIDRFFFRRKEKKILDVLKKEYNKYLQSIDVIHAHTLFSNGYIAYLLNKSLNIPYIVAIRNTDINIFFKYRYFLRRIGIEVMKNADKIIFLSNASKKEVFCKYIKPKDSNLLLNKTVVIPNGVDKFWIENKIRVPKKIKENEFKIIYVGQINKNKNVKSTILACKELIKDNKFVKFTVVGECRSNKFKKLLKEDFIEYHNHCSKEELISYYRESDVFVMPSIKETFGLVYAEALTQGIPVIYTSGQGFDEQFKNGEVGFSVNCKNINDIKNAILSAYMNYEDIQNRILKLRNVFDWNVISDEYKKLYKELVWENSKI